MPHRDADAIPHQLGKHLGKPGAARKDGDGGRHGVSPRDRHILEHRAIPAAEGRPADPDSATLLLEHTRHRLDRSAPTDDPGGRLVERDTKTFETNPRPAIGHLIRRQYFVGNRQRGPVAACVVDVWLIPLAKNEVARIEEQTGEKPLATDFVPLSPLLDRAARPPRPQPTVWTVSVRCAYAACLAPGRLP